MGVRSTFAAIDPAHPLAKYSPLIGGGRQGLSEGSQPATARAVPRAARSSMIYRRALAAFFAELLRFAPFALRVRAAFFAALERFRRASARALPDRVSRSRKLIRETMGPGWLLLALGRECLGDALRDPLSDARVPEPSVELLI